MLGQVPGPAPEKALLMAHGHPTAPVATLLPPSALQFSALLVVDSVTLTSDNLF